MSGEGQNVPGSGVPVQGFAARRGGLAPGLQGLEPFNFLVRQHLQAVAAEEPEQCAGQGGGELGVMGEQAHDQAGALFVDIGLAAIHGAKALCQLAQGLVFLQTAGAQFQGGGEVVPKLAAVLKVAGVIHRVVYRADCEYNGLLD